MSTPNGQAWTPAQIAYLAKNYDGGNVAVMTAMLGRSWDAIEAKAYREEIPHPKIDWVAMARARGIDPCVIELRAERERQEKSLDEVADRAGFARSTMVKWECGHAAPTVPALRIWAQALGLTIGFLEKSTPPHR